MDSLSDSAIIVSNSQKAAACTIQTSLLLSVDAAASAVKPQISSGCNFLEDKWYSGQSYQFKDCPRNSRTNWHLCCCVS